MNQRDEMHLPMDQKVLDLRVATPTVPVWTANLLALWLPKKKAPGFDSLFKQELSISDKHG